MRDVRSDLSRYLTVIKSQMTALQKNYNEVGRVKLGSAVKIEDIVISESSSGIILGNFVPGRG